MNIPAWLDGFQTGTRRKLGSPPEGVPQQSWLAGYLEGVEPPERYDLVERQGIFEVHRFDRQEGEPFAVEGGTFETRAQAEKFLQTLQSLFGHCSPLSKIQPSRWQKPLDRFGILTD